MLTPSPSKRNTIVEAVIAPWRAIAALRKLGGLRPTSWCTHAHAISWLAAQICLRGVQLDLDIGPIVCVAVTGNGRDAVEIHAVEDQRLQLAALEVHDIFFLRPTLAL